MPFGHKAHLLNTKRLLSPIWNPHFCKDLLIIYGTQCNNTLNSFISIDDEECNFRIRMALNHPCLSKIAQEYDRIYYWVYTLKIFRLNPSYDIFSDWSSLVYRNSNSELSGLQPTSKRKPSYNKRFIGITNTISSAIRRYNGIPSSSQEKLFRLLHLPRRPYGICMKFFLKYIRNNISVFSSRKAAQFSSPVWASWL